MWFAEKEDPSEPSQLIPIIIGSVIGGILAIALTTYLIIHFKNKGENTQLPMPVPASKN